ncbi:hypothetical protein L9G74_19405 [Shewanella sp. C32]|uniref:DUF4440 domain-containing protein n=1 Tax=Shewanella electrica TaxID=515560 RepID=A0ABT2FQI6_9GAMM|nr:hypothetical protein [Shewanella electrica]MCH1926988.1 hypothetical protein [Shewanella electrica]MCS4558609.1 hypothetical protein [Shewanella electrica]
MSNSVGNEENGLTMEGTTMKRILAVIATTLLMSASAYAEQPNYGFEASDINDPIFKEKCTAYTNALTNADADTVASFAPPEFMENYPDKFPKEVERRISKHKKMLAKYPYFKLIDISIRQDISKIDVNNPEKSKVSIVTTYEGSPKGTISISCHFKKNSDDKWIYNFTGR